MTLNKENLYLTFLNPRVFREVKQNIELLRKYNRTYIQNNLVHKWILDFIESTSINELTTPNISIEVDANALEMGLTAVEADDIKNKLIEYHELDNSDHITTIIKTIRSVVFRAKLDEIQSQHSSVEDMFRAISEFQYDEVDKLGLVTKPLKISQLSETDIVEHKLTTLFRTRLPALNKCFPCNGIPTGQLIQVVGSPGSGKSLLMMDLAMHCAGKGDKDVDGNEYERAKPISKALYIALGDLKQYNFIVRLASLLEGDSLDNSTIDQLEAYRKLKANKEVDDRFSYLIYESGEINIDQLCQIIDDNLNDYDLFIVDYDGNLDESSDSMYTQGHLVYKALSKYPLKYNKTVIIGSQPSRGYWKNEILPLECAAESSKKQQHVDCMITIGLYDNPYGIPCGKISVVKNRNGSKVTFNYVRANNGAFVQVSNMTYLDYCGRTLYSPDQHPSYDELVLVDYANIMKAKIGDSSPTASVDDARAWLTAFRDMPNKPETIITKA